MTILIPKLKIIFHIVGSTSGNFISFIFPNLFYIKLVKMTNGKQNLFLPTFLLIIGIIFLIISLVISIIKQD
jgi:amino acid permease